MSFRHLRALLLSDLWLVDGGRFESFLGVIERRISGERLSDAEIAELRYRGEHDNSGALELMSVDASGNVAAMQAGPAAGGEQQGGVIGVINVFGLIAQHARQVNDISGPGGTSTERVSQALRAAIADTNVKAVVLHIHSPGGNVHGVEELGNEIYRARGQKPIIAQVNSYAASAAYWIATQADEVVVTNGGEVGSIGVYTVHEDKSKKTENEGVKFTIISAGKYKTEGNSLGPLSEEAAQNLQARVESVYDKFIGAVARGRGVKAEDVRKGFGQGRVELAKPALSMGMADRIATFDETLKRLSTSQGRRNAMQASQPEAVHLQSVVENEVKSVHLVGEWPLHMLATEELLAEKTEYLQVEGDVVTFTLANAVASYRIVGRDNPGQCRCMRVPHAQTMLSRSLASAVGPAVVQEAEPARAAEQTPEERDAFRRRRHVHRLRSA